MAHTPLSSLFIRCILLSLLALMGACHSISVVPANNAPVANASNFIISFDEDIQSIITLSYVDTDGDLATSCQISSLSNITITQPCGCLKGVCTVGVTGTANYFGAASFDFVIKDNSDVSSPSLVALTIDSINDPISVTLEQASAQVDPTAALSINFTATFSTPIDPSTFTIADLTDSGTATGINWVINNSGDDQTFSLSATASSDGTLIPSLASGVVNDNQENFSDASSSTDNSVLLDSTPPTDNIADVQFTAKADLDGNDIAVTWTAFTDLHLANQRLLTFANAGCTVGQVDHGLTGATTNSNSNLIDGLGAFRFWIKVIAYDLLGNSTTSACSTDSIQVDPIRPTLSSINRKAAAINPTYQTSVIFTVTFSEAVSPVATSDFVLTTSGGTTGSVASVASISGSVYEVTVNTLVGGGTVRLDLNDADASIEDTSGHVLLDNTVDGNQTFTKYPPPFITVWKTDNLGTSATNQITLPVTGTNNFIVEWGDGTESTITASGAVTHTYLAIGTYTVKMHGSFSRIYFNNAGDRRKILQITQWGRNVWQTMASAFHGCLNLTIPAADTPDLSIVTNMSYMFQAATSLNQNLGGWDTSNVTNMDYMLASAIVFNQNIGGWDTSKVTTMDNMLSSAVPFNQDVSQWDTSRVTNMSSLFSGLTAFNQNISGWNTSAVTNMSRMFSSSPAFNQNIGGWNTSIVTDMSLMFNGATAFNQNISAWNTSNVTNMFVMFSGASAFNQNIGAWNTANVTDMYGMFSSATAFNQNIGAWNTAKVTTMSRMFNAAPAFNQNIGGWNTVKVNAMREMFSNATTFNQNIGGWDTAKVTDMGRMFSRANAFNQNIGGWNTSLVTSMDLMFYNALAFNGNISGWNTSKVTTMDSTFFMARAFNQNITTWNTSKVTLMPNMFFGAILFNQNLSGWNVGLVTDHTGFDSGATGWMLARPPF